MEKIVFKVLIISMVVLLLFACPTQSKDSGNSNSNSNNGYDIGDIGPSGVGIVFYITDNGSHGLEVALSSWNGDTEDPKSAWITGMTSAGDLNGNTLTGIGTGLANSNSIIGQLYHESSAAQLCRDYTGGGKTDWFLPSKDELTELCVQQAVIGKLHSNSQGYWSSSEINSSNAWICITSSNSATNGAKDSTLYRVRPVRVF